MKNISDNLLFGVLPVMLEARRDRADFELLTDHLKLPQVTNKREAEQQKPDQPSDREIEEGSEPFDEPASETRTDGTGGSNSSPQPKPGESLLERMDGASGEDIVSRIEDAGIYKFEGPKAQEMRDALVYNLDHSPFFKRSMIIAFRDSPNSRRLTFRSSDLDGPTQGHHDGTYGRVMMDNELTGDGLNYYLAHEVYHSFGIRDSADMTQVMEIWSAETGVMEQDAVGAEPNVHDSVDEELFYATREDWKAAGALIQTDYYDYGTDDMKAAMELIFGDSSRNRDVAQSFSDSSQRFEGDRDKIIQQYLDAKDGGKVEAIRAEQLKELGIADPEQLKTIGDLSDWYAENISIDRREVATFDNDTPRGMLDKIAELYRSSIDSGATEAEIADWIMSHVEPRIELTFEGDAAEAREILHNHVVKHDGKETMMAIISDFDSTLNDAVSIYANGGIVSENRTLWGFDEGPIKPRFQDMVRHFVKNIDPNGSARDAAMWVADQIRGRLGGATGEDETKLEIFDNYVNKKDRTGKQDGTAAAEEVFRELGLDPKGGNN